MQKYDSDCLDVLKSILRCRSVSDSSRDYLFTADHCSFTIVHEGTLLCHSE